MFNSILSSLDIDPNGQPGLSYYFLQHHMKVDHVVHITCQKAVVEILFFPTFFSFFDREHICDSKNWYVGLIIILWIILVVYIDLVFDLRYLILDEKNRF